MKAKLHSFDLPVSLLQRGFWLYVWKIRIDQTSPSAFYVGMTGDTGSFTAQSPINRVSAHLGSNDRSNALQRNALALGIDIAKCESIEFAAFGPVYDVPQDRETYQAERAKVAALEKALWLSLSRNHKRMINRCPQCRADHDPLKFAEIEKAFESFIQQTVRPPQLDEFL